MNHATLAGHTFQHELQVAADAGMLGSMDANRGDYQNGWDTDQFPNNLNELTESMLIILEAGGITQGGINFDAKTRRNSTDLEDIFIAHIAGMDTFARALVTADAILEKSAYKQVPSGALRLVRLGPEGAAFAKGAADAGRPAHASPTKSGEPMPRKAASRSGWKALSISTFKPVRVTRPSWRCSLPPSCSEGVGS